MKPQMEIISVTRIDWLCASPAESEAFAARKRAQYPGWVRVRVDGCRVIVRYPYEQDTVTP